MPSQSRIEAAKNWEPRMRVRFLEQERRGCPACGGVSVAGEPCRNMDLAARGGARHRRDPCDCEVQQSLSSPRRTRLLMSLL